MATSTQVTVDDPHAGAHGDGHGHDEQMLVGHDGQLHPSNLRHYFVSSEQQFESSKLGMWLFLATEILLFGGMFVAYGIFRVLYPEVYEAASLQLDTVLGATNTLVLLLSSLTMAWAIRGAQMDNKKVLIGNLVATMVLASGFLVVKYFEYSHKFHEGIYPGVNFQLREGTQSVSDFTGATVLSPMYEAPSHGDEHATEAHSDATEVEAEGVEAQTVQAPLTGADQAAPGASTGPVADAVGLEDGLEGAETGEGVAIADDGAGAAIDAEVVRQSDAAGAEADVTSPTELVDGEHGGLEGAPDKEAIFAQRRAGLFFSIYYVMTGIHAIHIVIGIIAIGFLTFFASKDRYSSVWYTPVENVGLYWHIVDIIWIFVFPLMYLI